MIIIVLTLLSVIVSSRLTSKFKEYSKIKLQGNLTGKDIAEMMLKNHDIIDVSVQCTEGHLTDHYNPTDKVINLSKEVYYGNHIAAAAVAAVALPVAAFFAALLVAAAAVALLAALLVVGGGGSSPRLLSTDLI